MTITEPRWKSYIVQTTSPMFTPLQCKMVIEAGREEPRNDAQVGKLGANAAAFSGKVDEVRFWDDVRTAAEIKDNYRKSITNPYNDSDLKLYLRMNSGLGSRVYDHSANMKHGAITNASWTAVSSSWSATLGKEGESGWNNFNDVDDFYLQ